MGGHYKGMGIENMERNRNLTVPIGYELRRIPEHEQTIEDTLQRVEQNKLSLREAAERLSKELKRNVSHEWVRQTAIKRKEKEND